MNKLKVTKTTVVAVSTALVLLTLTACQQEAEKPLTAEEKIVASSDHVRDLLEKGAKINQPVFENTESTPAVKTEGIGENMDSITFDGSSEATFRAGLDEFQTIANASELSALSGALTFLKVYDLSARGNTAKLYQVLDGMTAAQIVERAASIKRK